LTDEQVAGYYEKCRAVIICGEEDFNIVAVEAQSYGKPVIAYGHGGVTETVIPNKTGYFFNNQTAESLIQTVKQFKSLNAEDCIENAKKYSKERFKNEFLKYVRNN
jgi:glycosyltransferase involved in cell wall biosynthesis